MKIQADQHHTDAEFKVGQLVLVKLQPYLQLSLRCAVLLIISSHVAILDRFEFCNALVRSSTNWNYLPQLAFILYSMFLVFKSIYREPFCRSGTSSTLNRSGRSPCATASLLARSLNCSIGRTNSENSRPMGKSV